MKAEIFERGSKPAWLLILAAQSAVLAAAWIIWDPAEPGELRLALGCVLSVWMAAAGITLWFYIAFSLEPLPDLVAASLRDSRSAMWLAPGALLMAARFPAAVAVGLAAVVAGTRLLALNRAPEGGTIAPMRRAASKPASVLFHHPPAQPAHFSRETVLTMLGALALQTGVYALAGSYPLLAVVSFVTVTVIWTSAAVARGAVEARTAVRAPHLAVILTLLLTVTLTAALVHSEITPEGAGAPGLTMRVFERLAHAPPMPAPPPKESAKAPPAAVAARLVDTAPAIGARGRVAYSGVILRPGPMRSQKPRLILPGSRFRFSPEQPLAFPFTGEYQMFRTSSGSLPLGAPVETGTPRENLFRTTNGGPMTTVAVQEFDPPIDLTHCGRVVVTLRSDEVTPVMASMRLVAEGRIEDLGADVLGMKQAPQEALEFSIPVTAKPLLVRAIRISFQRPYLNPDQNVHIAVEQFTLAPRGR